MFQAKEDKLRQKLNQKIKAIAIDESLFKVKEYTKDLKSQQTRERYLDSNNSSLDEKAEPTDSLEYEMGELATMVELRKDRLGELKDHLYKVMAHFDGKMLEYDLKREKHEATIEQHDLELKRGFKRATQSKKDIYHWLRVNCSHPNLARLLRTKLVEMIQDRDTNQLLLGQHGKYEAAKHGAMAAQASSRGDAVSPIRGQETGQKVNLNRYKISVPHQDIVRFNQKELKEKQEVLHARMTAGKHPATPQPPTTRMVQSVRVDNNFIERVGQWTDDKESDFRTKRNQAKSDLCDIVKSVKYVDCGFSNMIQKILNNDDVKDLRQQLLLKHMDGVVLSSAELKYLSLTSEALNKYLDKKEYQSCTDVLDGEFIDTLVMCIAQEILDKYFELKKKLMTERKKYFLAKTKAEKDAQYYAELKIRRPHSSSKDLILAQKKQRLLKSSKDLQRAAADHVGFFKDRALSQAQTSRSPNQPVGKQASLFESHTLDPDTYQLQRNTLFGPMTKKEFTHLVHPPSKLLLEKEKHSVVDDKGRTHRLPPEVVKVEDKFRLRQSHSSKVVKPFNFVRTISTGPFSRQARFHKNGNLKTRAAITIQRFARGYIARRKYCYNGEGRGKLLEYKYNKLQRLRQQQTPFFDNPQSTVISGSHAPGMRDSKKQKMSSEDYQREAEKVKTKKKFDEQASKVIQLAKKNLWVALRSLDFVLLKTHLRAVDQYQNTALYYAALNQNYEMCKYFLSRGANPNAVCELKNTPFHCAFVNGSKQLISLFEEYKADKHATNMFGSKPHQMENVAISEMASTQRSLGEGSGVPLSSRLGMQGSAMIAAAQLSRVGQGLMKLASKDFGGADKRAILLQLGRKQSQSQSPQLRPMEKLFSVDSLKQE